MKAKETELQMKQNAQCARLSWSHSAFEST